MTRRKRKPHGRTIPDPQLFEDAIGRLHTGRRGNGRTAVKCWASCVAIAPALRDAPDLVRARWLAREYAESWFAPCSDEASGDFPGRFTDKPTRQQHHRALWLTLLALLAEEGQTPC